MVLVRFAYGFLDKLVKCSAYRLCPFAPPPLQGLHRYYGLMPHGFAGHFLPARLACYPPYTPSGVCRPWFPCSLHPSFTYVALASPSSPAAVLDWCDLLSSTFDLSGFLQPTTNTSIKLRQHPTWGGWLCNHPPVYEPYVRAYAHRRILLFVSLY